MLSGILLFLSGLGIMLFGIKTLGQGMQKITTGKIKNNISKFIRNRFQTFSCGTIITFLMQSSAASTVMTVGFVSTGILTLFQSLGIIVGCNVGTSFTGFLLSLDAFNVKEIFSCFCLIGIVLNFFKNQKVKDIGTTLLGFGLLFAGLLFISNGVDVLTAYIDFGEIISSVNLPILLIFIGLIITVMLQSSFAFIAIIITLISSGSGLSLYSASFLLFGANIGTCLTSLLVSLTTNADGKRTAIFHLMYNVVGTIIFSLLSFTGWVDVLARVVTVPAIQVVVLDVIFNLTTGILFLIILKPIEALLNKFVKEKVQPFEMEWQLDDNMFEIPAFAIRTLFQKIVQFYALIKKEYELTIYYLKTNDLKVSKEIVESYNQHLRIRDLLVKESVKITGNLTESDQQQLFVIHNILRILERLSNRLRRITDSLNFNGKYIKLNDSQQNGIEEINCTIKTMLDVADKSFDMVINGEYDIGDCAKIMLEQAGKVTQYKNTTKQKVVMSAINSEITVRKNTVYFGLLNDLDRLSNYLCDMVVGMIHINETKVEVNNEKNS